MKVGDLVKFWDREIEDMIGIIIRVDDSHRQSIADILYSKGLRRNIWENYIETINESR
jgi:hypothetical protein